jgi:hypothetical protein
MTTDKTAYAMAFLAGTIVWSLATIAAGGREAWDVGLYWTAAYPAALLIGGGLAALFPYRPWRWPLVVMFAQIPVMIAFGSGFGLLPLGLVLLAVLSLPGMAIAIVIGAWRRRTNFLS